MTDFTDKVCIITGSNEGIGKETAKVMAQRMMKVILACRNKEKCEAAAKEIREFSKNDNVICMQLDLNSLTSVKTFVQEFKNMNIPLNYLINNAGMYGPPLGKTEDGFESQFGVNHLGPFLLTNLLLEKLEESQNPRIVVLSSRAHYRATLNFDKLDCKDPKEYSALGHYGKSKLCNLLFAYELQRRLDEKGSKIVVNALHPGVVYTNLFSKYTVINALLPVFSLFLTKVGDSAAASSGLALGVEKQYQVKGKYFSVKEDTKSSDWSYKKEHWLNLWQQSCKFVGIPEDIQLGASGASATTSSQQE
eukprot:gene7411-8667_t